MIPSSPPIPSVHSESQTVATQESFQLLVSDSDWPALVLPAAGSATGCGGQRSAPWRWRPTTPGVGVQPSARAFRPAEGPFEFAIVQGRTLLLGSTEPEIRPTVATVRSAIDDYLGKPASTPELALDIGPRFAARQINVYCSLVGELSTVAETYAQNIHAELPNSAAPIQLSGWPAISTTLAVVSGGDLKTRLSRLLDRADREYYLPLLERAAEAAWPAPPSRAAGRSDDRQPAPR